LIRLLSHIAGLNINLEVLGAFLPVFVPKSGSKNLFSPSDPIRMSKSLNCPKIILDFIHINELSKEYSTLTK
jgi:hypothetical protein